MAAQETSSAIAGGARPGRRPYLAAGLLIGANLVDIVAISPLVRFDQFVLLTRTAIYQIDITGWVWLSLTIGTSAVVAGLLALSFGHGWVVPVGVGSAALALALAVALMPYAPLRMALVVPANAAAIRLLVRYRRPVSPAAPSITANDTPFR